MRKNRLCGSLAAAALVAASGNAFAGTVNIECAANSGALAAQFANGGTANTEYDITGPCNGNFGITQDNIFIIGAAGATQTINGGITITGATNFLLQDLTINAGTNRVSLTLSASGNIVQSTIQGDLVVFQAAQVDLSHTTISGGGLDAEEGAVVGLGVDVYCTNITNNPYIGIFAGGNSRVSGCVDISQSSAPNAPAIVAQDASSIHLVMDEDRVTGPDNGPTIIADRNSSISISGAIIATSSASTAGPAIVALHSSSVDLSGVPGFNGTFVTGPSNNHTVLVSQGSSALIQGSTITADTPFSANNQFAVIAAARNSSIVLGGGNTITNNAAGGLAVIVSAGSTLEGHNESCSAGGCPVANDTITGAGRIHTQSVIELGDLPVGGVQWNGNIILSHASSFRADGGNVTVNGTLTLDQASNGYFNHFAGTSNVISHVTCKSTTDHVSNPNLVFPPVTIGPPPGCALF